MLLVLLVLLWVVLLAPVVIRYFRDHGSDRSIRSFHHEHERLSRQEYVVAPAHRLAEPEPEYQPVSAPPSPLARRPRLTIVREDDTYRSLATRASWDEWEDEYEFDAHDREAAPSYGEAADEGAANHYARAYAAPPVERTSVEPEPWRRRDARQRRRNWLLGTTGVAVACTALALVTHVGLIVDLTALSWFAVVLYVAAGLYAMSQGYLAAPALPQLPVLRPRATTAVADEWDEPPYEAARSRVDEWDEEPQWERRAFG